ncbi:toprim domain-containing protein [Nocardioides terrisoli]|uniref:toprim domain-containing protein n=1 Tax=Nocardioides terrisoli TaxID=3388267 RepID=UPI00287B9BC0|nr:toprim domain-containing protein [Nocardioides marmorisolisilvae]
MNTTPHSPEVLFAANEDAATYFRRHLLGPEATGPRDYLAGRGFAHLLDDTIWTVGHAPASWTGLHDHLADLGYTDETMLAAGLVTTSRRGSLIDRFRNRVTFGIRDTEGHLIGFTGRAAPGADQTVPRYLNTPRTAIYDKATSLFGLGETASRIREGATPVLVEGPLDALAVDAANSDGPPVFAPLALCGTAFTPGHARQLAASSPGTIVIALDHDASGARAAQSAYFTLRETPSKLQAPKRQDSKDPAEILGAHEPSAVRAHLNTVTPLADRIVTDHLANWPDIDDNAEARICCLRSIARVVSRMQPSDISRQAARLASHLDLPGETVTRELSTAVHDVAKAPTHTRPRHTQLRREGPRPQGT